MAVLTADCLPILLCAKDGDVFLKTNHHGGRSSFLPENDVAVFVDFSHILLIGLVDCGAGNVPSAPVREVGGDGELLFRFLSGDSIRRENGDALDGGGVVCCVRKPLLDPANDGVVIS